jgi:hypothetical protein
MPVYLWSTTAATNATADSTINWAEGMAPSAVNDSARAQMAAEKKFFNDAISMTTTTGGTSTAYTLTTQSSFDTLAHLDKQVLTFVPNVTSGASPTLNVDSLGARPINGPASGTAIPTGALVAGIAYSVCYDNANNQFILLGYRDTLLNATITGTLAVTGATTFTGSVTFNGGAALAGSTFTGTATFSGAITFSGGLTASNTITMSGAAANEARTTIASAANVNIGAAAANYLQVTGTTTITAFDTVQAGTERTLEFAGALTLTNNNTSLILPGGKSITTAAGDTAIFRSEGSGNWRCIAYAVAAIPSAQSGNRVLLNTLVANNSATISDTTSLTSTYNEYEIVYENMIPATDNDVLELQVHSGGAFKTTSYRSTAVIASTSVSAVNQTSYIQLSNANVRTGTNGVSGRLIVFTPSNTSAPKFFVGTWGHDNGANALIGSTSGEWNGGNGAVDGFQILFGGGNITSGNVYIYGVIK